MCLFSHSYFCFRLIVITTKFFWSSTPPSTTSATGSRLSAFVVFPAVSLFSDRWSDSPGAMISTSGRSTPPSSSWSEGSPTWKSSGELSRREGSEKYRRKKETEIIVAFPRYQDILQGDFFEDYFLLAYKSLTWMLWSKMKCSQVCCRSIVSADSVEV